MQDGDVATHWVLEHSEIGFLALWFNLKSLLTSGCKATGGNI